MEGGGRRKGGCYVQSILGESDMYSHLLPTSPSPQNSPSPVFLISQYFSSARPFPEPAHSPPKTLLPITFLPIILLPISLLSQISLPNILIPKSSLTSILLPQKLPPPQIHPTGVILFVASHVRQNKLFSEYEYKSPCMVTAIGSLSKGFHCYSESSVPLMHIT